jgi:hypothetical protein
MTMGRHLTEETLFSRAEGSPLEGPALAHLEACADCRDRLAEVEEGLRLAAEARFVPEPEPAYWQTFRLQVERRLDEEPASWTSSWLRFLRPAVLVPVGAAALALVLLPSVRWGSAPQDALPKLEAWEALPAANDDGSLDVLRGLAFTGTDLEDAASCRDLADCLDALTEEETRTLGDALREPLPEVRS